MSSKEQFLEGKFRMKIKDICLYFNYPNDIINIIGYKTDEEFKEKDLNNYNRVNKPGTKDSRNALQCARNIIICWLYEDMMVEELNKCFQNNNINNFVILGGTDKTRCFSDKPKNTPDFIFTDKRGHSVGVEFIVDTSSDWLLNRSIKLRWNKLDNLQKEKAILFGYDPINTKFIMFRTNKVKGEEGFVFNKPGKTINMISNKINLYPYKPEHVIKKLKSILKE